ncbi:MAG: 3-phosphoserine/phosphohydroxythreonine transaminase [Bacteroidia bacterium]
MITETSNFKPQTSNLKHNFGAGPGILPKVVLEQAAQGILNFNNSGLSILEIGHRTEAFIEVMERARNLVKELLHVPGGYSVLFLGGGASTQFTMVPHNLLNTKAAYLETGTWAKKAIKEAQIVGTTEVIASSADKNFNYIPSSYSIPADADYLHLTSNNTIYGTQLKSFPDSPVPMVCDMSSDIFSRPVDVSKFALIYAGAQKNMGPAGTTCVIVKNDCLGKVSRKIPSMLNYQIHIDNDSMFNTPPVYAIYVVMLTLEWLKQIGGVNAIEKINEEKAALLYNEIDRNSLFTGNVAIEDRSLMNVCFTAKNVEVENKFLQSAKDAGIVGIKGHRSAGGFRASLYNALPIESVKVLADVMQEFERKNV